MKSRRIQQIAIAGILAAATGLTWAQEAPSTAAQPTGAPARGGLVNQLNLSPEQKSQIDGLQRALRAECPGKHKGTPQSPDCATKRRSTNKQVLAVLTPQQRTELKQLRAERRAAKMQSATPEAGTATGPSPTPDSSVQP